MASYVLVGVPSYTYTGSYSCMFILAGRVHSATLESLSWGFEVDRINVNIRVGFPISHEKGLRLSFFSKIRRSPGTGGLRPEPGIIIRIWDA